MTGQMCFARETTLPPPPPHPPDRISRTLSANYPKRQFRCRKRYRLKVWPGENVERSPLNAIKRIACPLV